jgi:tetratricopeptide (TPR) repeat protein
MGATSALGGIALTGLTGCAGRTEAGSASGEDGAPPADKYYEIAVGSFHNGMLEDAKAQIRSALRADENHADSLYLLGVILLHEGKSMVDAVESEMCLTDAAAGNQRLRADELHREAHDAFERASKAYEEHEPGRGRAFNSMAVVSLHFQEYDRAIEEATKSLDVQFYTERYSALSNLGWAYYKRGDNVEAMTELRQAVMFNPDYCVGRYRLAQVYLDADLNEQAAEEISRVIADERCPIQDAHRLYGVASLRMGQGGEAGAAFDACVALAPRSCLASECQRFSQLAAADAPGN